MKGDAFCRSENTPYPLQGGESSGKQITKIKQDQRACLFNNPRLSDTLKTGHRIKIFVWDIKGFAVRLS